MAAEPDTQMFLKAIHDNVLSNGCQLNDLKKVTSDTSIALGRLDEKVVGHLSQANIHYAGDCPFVRNTAAKLSKHVDEHPRIVKQNIALLLGGSVLGAFGAGVILLKVVEYLGN